MIDNSAADCSISLEVGTESDQATHDLQQTFKVNGSETKVTAWRNVVVNC